MSRGAAAPEDAPSYGIGDRFERIFVVAFSIGGIAFHAVAALGFAEDGGAVSPLWAVAAAVLVLPAPLVTLIVATRGSLGAVRIVLRAHVVLFAVVVLALVPAVPPGSGGAVTSWLIDAVPVAMTAAAVAFPARVVPLAVAAVCLLLFGVRAATSGSPSWPSRRRSTWRWSARCSRGSPRRSSVPVARSSGRHGSRCSRPPAPPGDPGGAASASGSGRSCTTRSCRSCSTWSGSASRPSSPARRRGSPSRTSPSSD
ncbi:hypothetical protein Q0F99_13990 [Rathayibacter oskolensis]|uniref:hypothetical protein n=1 Tax=Rathayibacter oskolensis TaxID=1891671 RepID=UPI00265D69D6|nr:hypothetical protein [Rathayibacter oskolensis]WKK70855.1 hypothetical protein Q0F99_13990 [Rathayibacter oskolensis]